MPKRITALFTANPITFRPGDILPATNNRLTTATSGAGHIGQVMRDRYKINPSVATNDLTVTVTHLDGTAPSTTDPLYWKIGNSIRAQTAALSVVKVDGTSWANLGAVELGGLEHELFQYVVWNTALGTPAVDTFWSRYPFGKLFSTFSTTSSAQNYAAQTASATAPNSTDECECIGKFAATLSLTGTGHLWTVPSFTNLNLVSAPVNQSGWKQWTPVFTGFSADPTNLVFRYKTHADGMCEIQVRMGANGTSNATSFSLTLPFTAQTVTNGLWGMDPGASTDNGTVSTVSSLVTILSAGSIVTINKDAAGTAWTAANGKRISHFSGKYALANY